MKAYVKEKDNEITIQLFLNELTCLKSRIEMEEKDGQTTFKIKSELFSGLVEEEENAMSIFELWQYLEPLKGASPAINTYIVTVNFLAQMKFNSMPKYGKNGIIENGKITLSDNTGGRGNNAPPPPIPFSKKI